MLREQSRWSVVDGCRVGVHYVEGEKAATGLGADLDDFWWDS